jgi:predicted transcriptional regulator
MTESAKGPIAVRLPPDVIRSVDDIAAASDRSRSWVILRALRLYLVSEGADIIAIAKAREASANGGGVDFDDVIGEIDRIIAGSGSKAA